MDGIIAYVLAKDKANKYTDDAIAALPKGLVYKGSVNYQSDLPTNATIGDCYTVEYKGTTGTEPWGAEFAWGSKDGTNQWIRIGADANPKWGEIEGTLSNQTDLNTALEGKVDKVDGKQLSTNDFTDTLLTKLNGIAEGAEVNVQADWTETDTTKDSYIQNKPSLYNKKTLFSDGNQICEDAALTKALTFTEVKAILDNSSNDVELWNGNYILLPEYSNTKTGVTSIWFNGTTELNGNTYMYCIKIDSNNNVTNDEHQLYNTSNLVAYTAAQIDNLWENN